MGLLLITRFTLQEALRRRLFLAIIILSSLLLTVFAIILNVGINALKANIGSADSYTLQLSILGGGIFITIMATWLVYLLSSVLTIVLTAGMISSEIEAGTFAVIVPKPLSRAEIVLGKWLGYALLLGVYTALLFFAFLGIIYWQTGYWPPQFVSATGTLELGMFTLLGLMTVGSAFVPTIVNGAIALVLFIGAPIASIVQFVIRFAVPAQSTTMQDISTIISLIIPTDALWHGTSFYLLPSSDIFAVLRLSSNNFDTPFTSATEITIALLSWAMLYSLVLPSIAVLRFQRRDL